MKLRRDLKKSDIWDISQWLKFSRQMDFLSLIHNSFVLKNQIETFLQFSNSKILSVRNRRSLVWGKKYYFFNKKK